MHAIHFLSAYFFGRTVSYLCNANEDAEISKHILTYVHTGKLKYTSESQKRTKLLIQKTPKDKHSQRLIVQSYTQYWLNGYMDFETAKLLKKILQKHIALRPNLYKKYEKTKPNLLFPWVEIVFSNFQSIYDFAKENNIQLTLTKKQIIEEIIRVQEENKAYNRKIGSLLKRKRRTKNKKVLTLRKHMQKSSHPEAFLNGATHGQTSANIWDTLFVMVLRFSALLSYSPLQ